MGGPKSTQDTENEEQQKQAQQKQNPQRWPADPDGRSLPHEQNPGQRGQHQGIEFIEKEPATPRRKAEQRQQRRNHQQPGTRISVQQQQIAAIEERKFRTQQWKAVDEPADRQKQHNGQTLLDQQSEHG